MSEKPVDRLIERNAELHTQVAEKDAEIARLKSVLGEARPELERLKPSGQVAEDEKMLRGVLHDEGFGGVRCVRLALARLATGAQAAQALADALERHGRRIACPTCGGIGSRTCATCDNGATEVLHPDVVAALRLVGRAK